MVQRHGPAAQFTFNKREFQMAKARTTHRFREITGIKPQIDGFLLDVFELSEPVDTDNIAETEAETEAAEGFSFFKKAQDAETGETGEDPVLVAIEQEMLAVRRLYTGGHVIKDVYVSETRRLYAKAQAVKNSQSE